VGSKESIWFKEIFQMVRKESKARPSLINPFILRFLALFNPELSYLVPFNNQPLSLMADKASTTFGVDFKEA
jgi:hypothetical protein